MTSPQRCQPLSNWVRNKFRFIARRVPRHVMPRYCHLSRLVLPRPGLDVVRGVSVERLNVLALAYWGWRRVHSAFPPTNGASLRLLLLMAWWGCPSELVWLQVCLGTMTWGTRNTEAEAHEQLDYAVKAGLALVRFSSTELCIAESFEQGGV